MSEVEKDRLEAWEWLLEAKSDTVRRALQEYESQWWKDERGFGPKTARKYLRGDVESRSFVSGSVRSYKRGGIDELFRFQHNFKWRFNK